MRDKIARRRVGALALAVKWNLDAISDLRRKDELAHTGLVALIERVDALEAQNNVDVMVALQNVEAMLLTRIRNLTERVEKLEGLQWTAEEVLGESGRED